ncbi:uncharacterized protein Tco025E_08074 [Trypanosoma conorhini]|uniref:Uncharacterized protein n=1 Tax=Trypanosoma conorhini TaxID=83891 RepID=A0A422NEP8_9TRYP|nr:uncharacterized protein Tco025E_08074 [Trypanosoma conorhini]RNF03936.1 hypothetical protein Tco025E_08074 [Trypanosoma conorhini]
MSSCGVDGILALDERGANCCCRPFSSGSHSGVGHVAGLQVVYICIYSQCRGTPKFLRGHFAGGRVGPCVCRVGASIGGACVGAALCVCECAGALRRGTLVSSGCVAAPAVTQLQGATCRQQTALPRAEEEEEEGESFGLERVRNEEKKKEAAVWLAQEARGLAASRKST